MGSVTSDIVRSYVRRQFLNHRAAPAEQREMMALARYHDPRDATTLRRTDHVTFEYNMHFVFVTRRRFDFLDPYVSEALIAYWRRVCKKYNWIAWDIEVIWNHAHLF